MEPVILSWDNWTPPARTPWGGRKIAERLKAGLEIAAEKRAWPAIGESWELSVDPAFPSRVMRDGRPAELLAELLASDPAGWLGPAAAARGETSTPLRVKLINLAALGAVTLACSGAGTSCRDRRRQRHHLQRRRSAS
ncbi:MAG: hypothetical protein U1F43_08710 [Myxococcota bacterium]